MNKEETIIINDELFYRIPNGTSYDYAPIPKEFKPYFERLQQQNKELHNKIDKVIEFIKELDKECEEDGCSFVNLIEVLKILEILKDSDVDE